MSHNKLLDRDPSVILTTSNKNELKVYQGNQIYLNHGDNFELRLFNPLNEKIGVEIIFNGIKKGDSYLVLNPGQDVTLDRFLDEQRKMLFETYTVDGNNKSAMKAIEQNGLITFNFYKEYNRTNFINYNDDVNINYNFPPKPYNYSKDNVRSKSVKGTRGINGINGTGGLPNYGTLSTSSIQCSSTPGIYGSSTVTNLSNINSTYTSNLQQDYLFSTSTVNTSAINTIETGRVEKGDLSEQQLKQVNAQFQSVAFHTISYKMLPYSAKSVEITEVRHYCTECSYRLRKQTWKFCPHCGNSLT